MKKLISMVVILILMLCAVASAEQSAYEETVIAIQGADYEIPATVCMPAGEGPFPAVVMLHGTGSTRDEAGNGYLYAAPVLAEKYGIATIRIDFPGNGESKADYMQYTFKSAVADAKAAAEYMAGLGCLQAYNLDGGNSAEMIFNIAFYGSRTGNERDQSDIIYFATAVDPAEWKGQ